jgi:hypothetical protein
MFTHGISFVRATALAVALLLAIGGVKAQGQTAFTYQGELASDGAPLTGQADLRVQLFTAATDGAAVGEAIDLPSTTVTNGLFTALLDFGNAFDAGQPRWLEISVRSPAGSGPFATLSPRQAITAAPLAQGLAGIAITRGGPEVLDQAQDAGVIGSANVGFNAPSWQSWTAAVTGNLTRLQVRAGSATFNTETLTVTVRNGRGLSGPVLGVVTIAVDPAGSSVDRDIDVPSIPVQAGTVYTFEFSGQVVLTTTGSGIPGAAGNFGSGPRNWWFRTFVSPSASINATAISTAFAAVSGAAVTATTAERVPWSGLTGQAAILTGSFGIGTTTPGARMEINAGAGDGLLVRTSNATPWALRIGNDNATALGFETGMYMTDNGFFRVTNRIANASGTYAQLGSNGVWTALSDARLKTDVTSADGNLAAAMKLRPVNFRWKGDGAEDFGLIAQEVREVLPKLVVGDEATESLTVSYSQLSVVAIGAIQELKAENDRKQREIDELRARLAAMEATLKRMEEDGK